MRYWGSMLAAIMLCAGAASAQAHAHLRGAVPADGSVVSVPPREAVLDFSEDARLTAAWIQRSGGARMKIESLPQQSAAKVAVPLPQLSPGVYELSWRALSADGHIVPGHIRFTVARPGAAKAR